MWAVTIMEQVVDVNKNKKRIEYEWRDERKSDVRKALQLRIVKVQVTEIKEGKDGSTSN
jgi:CRISPR/Cas system-associated exonuclease Cas4 (RecB family)